jgi:hypothetical protein
MSTNTNLRVEKFSQKLEVWEKIQRNGIRPIPTKNQEKKDTSKTLLKILGFAAK